MPCPNYSPSRISHRSDPREARRVLANALAVSGPRTIGQLRHRRFPYLARTTLQLLLRHHWFERDAEGRYDVTTACRIEYLDPLARLGRVKR